MASANPNRALRQLQWLAEFRYQLRGFLHFSEEAAARAGLRAQQYQLLQVVAAMPQDDLPTIAHVAERMLLRHNSAVELIDRTEQQGLLRRVPDKVDHRRMRLKLSAKGERVLARLVKEHVAELQRIGPAMRQTLNAVANAVAEPAAESAAKPAAKKAGSMPRKKRSKTTATAAAK